MKPQIYTDEHEIRKKIDVDLFSSKIHLSLSVYICGLKFLQNNSVQFLK